MFRGGGVRRAESKQRRSAGPQRGGGYIFQSLRRALSAEQALALDLPVGAIEAGDQFVAPIKTCATLDPFRTDPRFHALLRRMNLEP